MMSLIAPEEIFVDLFFSEVIPFARSNLLKAARPRRKPRENPLPGTPLFLRSLPPQSGPYTGSDSPLFPNGAQFKPRFRSANLLSYRKLLEELHEEGVRQSSYDGESVFTTEI